MIKTVFIHGRPSGHPIHDNYAKLVEADFCFSDHKIRWNDIENVSKIKRTLSWFVCAITFPKRNQYDVFFSEGVRELLLIMKWLRLINKKQKIVALMANENLYFLKEKRYSFFANLLMKAFLKKCDALICIGEYQADLARKICPSAKIYSIFNGIPSEKMKILQDINPDLNTNKILVISNASSETRMFYKGLDLAFLVFNELVKKSTHFELHIIGDCDSRVINYCFDLLQNSETKKKCFFYGNKNIEPFLASSSLLMQLGRGDSYPTSTIEAASAGVPVFVTKETGVKEMVNKVDELFIADLNIDDICLKIEKYLKLPLDKKKQLSLKFKSVAKNYTDDKANINFLNTFQEVCTNFNIKK